MIKLIASKSTSFIHSTQRNNTTNKQLSQALQRYYKKNDPLIGFCNQSGTQNYAKINQNIHQDHWKSSKFIPDNLKLSSIGIGTQSGAPDHQTDIKMFESIFHALKSGTVNVIDTDINFRYGKSEKTINAVLNYLHHQHKINRNSFFISTKCGYLPQDIDSGLDQKAMIQLLLEDQLIQKQDILNQAHCLHPNFIKFCVEKSLYSLGLQTIDLLYLNNPAELQQTALPKKQYFDRLAKSFETLQQLREAQKIRYYGISSFLSFRSPPEEQGIHSELLEIVELAKKIGGQRHGFRFLLVPFNLGMPEILAQWQTDQTKGKQNFLAMTQKTQVNVNFCSPLFQGRAASLPFQTKLLQKIKSNSAKHLQMARSVPYSSVVSAIFGSINSEHVQENLEVSKFPKLKKEQWKSILGL